MKVIATGIPGTVLTVAGLQIHNPAWLGYILLSAGIFLFVVAAANLIVSVWYERAAIIQRLNEANAITPELLLLRERARLIDGARNLDDQAKRIVLDNTTLLGVSYALFDEEPLVSGTNAPYWFFVEWLEQSDEVFLAPIGSWSEGSDRQEWAKQLTRLFVVKGQASGSAGNRSARWASPEIYSSLARYYLQNSPTPPD